MTPISQSNAIRELEGLLSTPFCSDATKDQETSTGDFISTFAQMAKKISESERHLILDTKAEDEVAQ